MKNAVIANQCAHWCGNPPVERNQVTITTKNRGELLHFWCFSVHFPTNRGIATTSLRTGLAMTENLKGEAINNNSPFPWPLGDLGDGLQEGRAGGVAGGLGAG